MYLTRLKLDLTKRTTMLALREPNRFHGAVEGAFPGGRERRLWRIDSLRGEWYLLLLSRTEPDLSEAAAQFGADGGWETLPYGPLLERIAPGTRWHFRLTANPTVSRPKAQGVRGKVYAHITPQYQERWLLDRAPGHGFALEPGEFLVTGTRWYRFRKQNRGRPVTLLAVSYEGTLTVTDADLFRRTLTEGIGRGRAYGMGLLTVAGEG